MNFIPVSEIMMDDPLWSKRFILVREVVLPYMWEILNDRIDNATQSHCIENFKVVAGLSDKQFNGAIFTDSDLYKWIEAVSYGLIDGHNEKLNLECEKAIDLIEAAQQPDGYLNTYYQSIAPEKKWTNLMEGHELYCAGHLIEAAVAHHQATGSERLLNIARRFADLIDRTFGLGKMRGYPGHPEIELALIRLFEETNETRYLTLANYFINERGVGDDIFVMECKKENHVYLFPDMRYFKADYFQSHLPVREQKSASGHAVRAMYLYSAMADIARHTKDRKLIEACEGLFQNIISRQMYVTGGVGSAKLGERFTTDYDLPTDSAYSETCAAIGLMFFSSRMWLITQNKTCYDIWEQALYNTVLSGMGKDGKHYFYVNPIEVIPENISKNPTLFHVKTQRQKWFGVACCPPNLARILSSLTGYIYALKDDQLFILSHIDSSFNKGGISVNLSHQEAEYSLSIDGAAKEIVLRVPENSLLICEQCKKQEDGYFSIDHRGGKMEYSYSLIPQIRVLRSHPKVAATAGKLCVQRGLTTYCVEGADNATPLSALRLPENAVFSEERVDWLDDSMPILKTMGYKVSEKDWGEMLYSSKTCVYESCEITFIPYSQWGNRGENEMRVWLTEK